MRYLRYNEYNSVLLAPNGKPSNLTPRQYKLVRSDSFIRWFGNWIDEPEKSSKVVDNNGEPLVCYHSTDELDLKFFDRNQKLAYFSNENFWRSNRNTISVFLNIRNIYGDIYKNENDDIMYIDNDNEIYTEEEVIEKLSSNDIVKTDDSESMYEFLLYNGYQMLIMQYFQMVDEYVVGNLKKRGYDGCYISDFSEVAVFNSSQIKIVI